MNRILALIAVLAICVSAQAANPTKQSVDFFETKIRPVLIDKCYSCHSSKAAAENNLKGGLLLDTREAARRGGESGPAVVPGKPDEGTLIGALRHDGFEMPPDEKLPNSVVADFVHWIKTGAADPRDGNARVVAAEIDIDAGRQFWSFRGLRELEPPNVRDAAWGRTAIDRFIRARQEEVQVQPNAIADARTLVRRAYFDLIGLPPAPAELKAAIAEISADSDGYEQMIDRLLDSPHFGERWGRHWLDLARFAESNGYAFDKDRPNAYRYRDFVIRSFNDDMPYDQFVRLQIAGDLLANTIPETSDQATEAIHKLAATGFLVAGPFTTQQTQKERERSRYEQLDDIVHTLGTSLLGLTVGCCRCHSHKYDPLPMQDYYRFTSCFADVGFSDTGVNTEPKSYRQAKVEFDKAHAPLAEALEKFEKDLLEVRFQAWFDNRPNEQPLPMLGAWHHVGPFPDENFDKAFDQAFGPEKVASIDLAKTYQNGKLRWTEQPDWVDGVVHNTLTGENSANYLLRIIDSPIARKVSLSLGSDDGIKVWVNRKEVLKNKVGRGAAADQEKVEIALKKGRNELLLKIVNGAGPSGFYFKATLNGAPAEIERLLKMPRDQWSDPQHKQVVDWYKTLDDQWLSLNAKVQEHLQSQPKPNLTMIYSAKVRGSTYNFGANTYKVFQLRRGNPDNKDVEAAPGFLRVLLADGRDGQQYFTSMQKSNPIPPRVALADWLTDVDHGAGHLLARVIVNRLWHYHFGRGLVSTPSDFGTRGEAPTHPELLDWLAAELIRNQWRLKPIHKLIMTSAVYMQDGKITRSGGRSDPENLLLWRRPSRRLEAEVIRDALLAVSGSLDDTMFGKGSLDARTPRRSIYLTVKRSNLIPMLQLFDAPDAMQSVGDREESTVAPQALTLLNSPVVRDFATKFARRARGDDGAPLDEAIETAYRIALARPPSAEERGTMLAFIDQQTKSRGGGANAESMAFRDFCHLLLCMNEFVYVD